MTVDSSSARTTEPSLDMAHLSFGKILGSSFFDSVAERGSIENARRPRDRLATGTTQSGNDRKMATVNSEITKACQAQRRKEKASTHVL